MNDHTFFSNTDCKYFPCHEVADKKTFNCLFCFCPLYWLDNCGGTPEYISGVKDCSGCLVPHEQGGYEQVLNRLRMEYTKRKGEEYG